ncbi:hypothetical protein QVD17_41668 [Tagetes erecta]|uniref:Uncharacterized protein n=1 Tax=Tagetes erecta TaxID=13708 RepID=A0AAD8JL08_TARER|nr:hypothetical protein QVD17_41668 [Tagetes erecta]
MLIESGDIQGIIDPALGNDYDIQSMWKIAEKTLMCVQPHEKVRPSMSEVIKDIQDAILIQRGVETILKIEVVCFWKVGVVVRMVV